MLILAFSLSNTPNGVSAVELSKVAQPACRWGLGQLWIIQSHLAANLLLSQRGPENVHNLNCYPKLFSGN